MRASLWSLFRLCPSSSLSVRLQLHLSSAALHPNSFSNLFLVRLISISSPPVIRNVCLALLFFLVASSSFIHKALTNTFFTCSVDDHVQSRALSACSCLISLRAMASCCCSCRSRPGPAAGCRALDLFLEPSDLQAMLDAHMHEYSFEPAPTGPVIMHRYQYHGTGSERRLPTMEGDTPSSGHESPSRSPRARR